MPRRRRPLAETFWEKVDKRGPKDCWPWMATRSRLYGMVWLPANWPHCKGGRMHQAHRVAYYLHTRVWPGDLDVCHSCDNPPCCNPGHLWLGTAAQNAQDSAGKGRNRGGQPPGERHPQARLTDAQCDEIRARRADGWSYQQLGTEYGIHPTYASMLCRNRRGPGLDPTRQERDTLLKGAVLFDAPENVIELTTKAAGE